MLDTLDVVLFDLDSTLANTSHRHHLAPTRDSSKTWADYAAACIYDVPIAGTVRILHMLMPHKQIHIISGRDGSAYDKTAWWLRKNWIYHDRLTLRENDELSNAEIKVNYIKKLREEGLNPELLFDDWPSTVAAVEAVGVPVVCVGNTWHREPEPVGVSG